MFLMSQNCFLKHVHKVLESIAMICLTILLACGSELYREHCSHLHRLRTTCQFPGSVYTKSQSMSVLVCRPQKQDNEDHANFWTQSRLSTKFTSITPSAMLLLLTAWCRHLVKKMNIVQRHSQTSASTLSSDVIRRHLPPFSNIWRKD